MQKKARNYLYLVGIACFVVFLLSSCISGEKKYKTELLVLDSLSAQLDSATLLMKQFDSVAVQTTIDSIKADLLYIQNHLSDTLIQLNADVISNYKSFEQVLTNTISDKAWLATEIKNTRIQLENLKHDFKNKLHAEDKLKEYFDKEKSIVLQLITAIGQNGHRIKKTYQEIDSTKTYIRAFIQANDTTQHSVTTH